MTRSPLVRARACALLVAVVASSAAIALAACGDDASTNGTTDGGTDANKQGSDGARDDGSILGGDGGNDTSDASTGDAASDGGSDAGPCPPGTTLLRDKRACDADASAAPSAFADLDAAPGDIVSMAGLDEGTLPCAPAVVCVPNGSATMLFSDDPESPTTDGVLYADTVVAGHYRIYVYHANGAAAARKFPIVVLNQGAADAHVTIKKKGVGTAGTDYVAIGKSVAAQWMDSSLSTVVTVPPATRVLLDADLDAVHTNKDDLAHAIFDVETDATVKISVVSVLANEDAATVTAGLSLLADDALHDRGTFPNADLLFVIAPPAGGARNVRLGDGTTEPELPGTDMTNGGARTLGGNYGVFYTFQIAAPSITTLAFSPRGGDWGGVAAPAIGSQAASMPNSTSSLASTTNAAWLGRYGAGTIGATLVSAGGSNLPVDLVVMTK